MIKISLQFFGGRGGGGSGGARGGRAGGGGKPTLSGVEDSIRNNSYESAAVFDENGNMVLQKVGGDHEVRFSKADLAAMKNGTFTHNHTSSGEAVSTFSAADINLATRSGLHEMRAVEGNKTYILTKTANKRARNSFSTDYADAMRREGNRLSLSITSNKVLSQKLTSFCSNWLKNNASKYGYTYRETTK